MTLTGAATSQACEPESSAYRLHTRVPYGTGASAATAAAAQPDAGATDVRSRCGPALYMPDILYPGTQEGR